MSLIMHQLITNTGKTFKT